MTVEIEYRQVDNQTVQWAQTDIAQDIASRGGWSLHDITRIIQGTQFTVRIDGVTLPDQAVENARTDIAAHLNSMAEHVRTREV